MDVNTPVFVVCALLPKLSFHSRFRPGGNPICMPSPNYINGQQKRSSANGGIGNIENRPMVLAGMRKDKVDYISESNPVDQISCNPCQQQGTRPKHSVTGPGRA